MFKIKVPAAIFKALSDDLRANYPNVKVQYMVDTMEYIDHVLYIPWELRCISASEFDLLILTYYPHIIPETV